MKLCSVSQSVPEWIALAFGIAPTPIMDTLIALLLAKSIMAAAGIGLFDVLQDGPLTVDEISTRCDTHPSATGKLLRSLHACKYVECKNNAYSLSAVSRQWLVSTRPSSLHAAVLHRNLDLRFMDFETYLREGKSQAFHQHLTPEEWRIYHEGQASHAALIVKEVIARAPLPQSATRLLDLGGAHGLYSFAFCHRYPRLRALVVDLEITTEAFKSSLFPHITADRVEFQKADILTFDLPAEEVDAVLIANVFHHFDEPSNRSLILRATQALRPGGILIGIDAVRADAEEESEQVESLLDLYFGAASGAGLWTIEQVRAWQVAAGLNPNSPVKMRLAPCCKMLVGKKVKE